MITRNLFESVEILSVPQELIFQQDNDPIHRKDYDYVL